MGAYLPYVIVGLAGLVFFGTLAVVGLVVIARLARRRRTVPAARPTAAETVQTVIAGPRPVSGAAIVSDLATLQLQGAGRALEDSAYASGPVYLATLGIQPAPPPTATTATKRSPRAKAKPKTKPAPTPSLPPTEPAA